MDVYFIRHSKSRWFFYITPKASTPKTEDTLNTNFRSRFWQKLHSTYTSSMSYIQTSPKFIWKYVRKAIGLLETFVHPSEQLIRALANADNIQIFYPEGINQSFVEKRWHKVLKESLHRHSRGIILNVVLLPFTAAATMIPGPNVFVGWNGLRLYCHIMAKKGAKRALNNQINIQFLLTPKLNKYSPSNTYLSPQSIEVIEKEITQI